MPVEDFDEVNSQCSLESHENQDEVLTDELQSGELKLTQPQLNSLIDRLLSIDVNDTNLNVTKDQVKNLKKRKRGRPKKETLISETPNLSQLAMEIRRMNDNICARLDEIEKVNKHIIGRIESVEKSVADNFNRINYLENCIADLGALINNNALIISGEELKVDPDNFFENLKRKLSYVAEVDESILAAEISVVNLGKSNNKAKLIVKNQDLKIKILTKFRSKRPSNLFVSEFLSPYNAEIAAKLRALKRDGKLHSVYSFRGCVYYKLRPDSQGIPVKTCRDIEELKCKI